MLINDFFTVTSLSGEAPSFRALLTVNARHRIFDGHFPGQPVVPGVCLMQMVQEVAGDRAGRWRLAVVTGGSDEIHFPSRSREDRRIGNEAGLCSEGRWGSAGDGEPFE